MSAPKFFLGDEELGKKYDDHNHGKSRFAPISPAWRPPRRKRFLLAVVGIALLYLFLKRMPSEPPKPERIISPVTFSPSQPLSDLDETPDGPPPLPEDGIPNTDHYYDERIRFFSLARSLYSGQGLRGFRRDQKVVLFAVADLKVLSDMLPVACDMASRRLNRVHLVLMGRDEVSIEGIQMVHNLKEAECPLIWHDARPDYGPWSTDSRMETSVRAGLGHIRRILHPKVIITRGEGADEAFLVRGVGTHAAYSSVAHIALPNRTPDYKWIADLDSSALAAWNQIHVEVLVQASPESGSLIRLLRSLHGADYFGEAPRLTIELPLDTDPSLLHTLRSFTWPPYSSDHDFTLRRRIHPHDMTPEDATIRAVDAVYPKNSNFSHVLVVSPQAELAPSFFHFLKYTLLKYKYSKLSEKTAHELLGISLELPSNRPTDGKEFSVPEELAKLDSSPERTKEIPALLWEVPNSNAALYFGDKWIEFQSFLSHRFTPSLQKNKKKDKKLISKIFPAWTEYMLEFMRARGYHLLYPAFANQDELSLVTMHNELYQAPEEFELPLASDDTEPDSKSDETGTEAEPKIPDPKKPLSGSETVRPKFIEKNLPGSSNILELLETYPDELPDLLSIPVLPYTGELTREDPVERAETFAQTFREKVGGCTAGKTTPETVIKHLTADDLFCS